MMLEKTVMIFDRECTIKFNRWSDSSNGQTKFFINLISKDGYYKLHLASYPISSVTCTYKNKPWKLCLTIYNTRTIFGPVYRSFSTYNPPNIREAKRMILKYLMNENID